MSICPGPPSSQTRITDVPLPLESGLLRFLLDPEDLRKAETGHAGGAELQEVATSESVARTPGRTEGQSKHDVLRNTQASSAIGRPLSVTIGIGRPCGSSH